MKLSAHLLFFVLLALTCTACSSSSATVPQDAGPDAAPVEAGARETGSSIPDAAAPFDAGNACDRLKETVDQAGDLARACDPASSSPCAASVDGLCCPITVDSSSGGAVNDFQEAVKSYKAKCKPDCTKVLCSPNPGASGICDQAGRTCH